MSEGEDPPLAPLPASPLLGCVHYRRKCKLVAPCCSKAYNCRFCHDEAEEDHTLDRRKVLQVECLGCSTVGPAEAQCSNSQCGLTFGEAYFCPVCRLYDDVDKGQFHCKGCGICRVGGRDKFVHCDTCGLCLPKTAEAHKCLADSSKNNCPVCMEDIHTSRNPAHVTPCSHLLHTSCYQDMLARGLYACPTCGLSMQDMTTVWRSVDREVAATPMPREYAGLHRHILCKDCNTPSTVTFHVVGMKCGQCGSYNTTLDKGPLLVAVEEAEGGGFRPLTEAEEKLLAGASFPPPPTVPDSGEDSEEGWETTEEEQEHAEEVELQEEELD